MPGRFQIGNEYRRRDLHAAFGGQEQGGISTPAQHPLIFLVTGKSGEQYGYHDAWEDSGVFRYFGEGRVGNMRFERGNEAVRSHGETGRELHLFEDQKKGMLRYVGEMTCAGWRYEDNVPDQNGDSRRAIVFYLASIQALSDNQPPPDVESPTVAGTGGANPMWSQDLDELRKQIVARGTQVETSKVAAREVHRRSRALRIYVLRRANGICEACGQLAPFSTPDGRPFLEAHHTRRLSDGGLDEPRWVAGICPNCHRRAHYADDAESFNSELQTKLGSLEPAA